MYRFRRSNLSGARPRENAISQPEGRLKKTTPSPNSVGSLVRVGVSFTMHGRPKPTVHAGRIHAVEPHRSRPDFFLLSPYNTRTHRNTRTEVCEGVGGKEEKEDERVLLPIELRAVLRSPSFALLTPAAGSGHPIQGRLHSLFHPEGSPQVGRYLVDGHPSTSIGKYSAAHSQGPSTRSRRCLVGHVPGIRLSRLDTPVSDRGTQRPRAKLRR